MENPFRVGIGYDVHRLIEGRRLVLGGVDIPYEKGLLGHSDADALSHAICDALLGAAAVGDIGSHFPDNDPQFSDASSLKLLERASDLVVASGFVVANVDSVIIAEMPRLAPHIPAMRELLASSLKIEVGQVSIKSKTAEGLDSIGRGEAIAAQAIVLIRSYGLKLFGGY